MSTSELTTQEGSGRRQEVIQGGTEFNGQSSLLRTLEKVEVSIDVSGMQGKEELSPRTL